MLLKTKCLVSLFLLLCQAYQSLSFHVGKGVSRTVNGRLPSTCLLSSSLSVDGSGGAGDDNLDDDELDEEIEPGKMRVSEIKAELELRGVEYKDCFDKESLSERLLEARATGKANPAILEKFNRAKLEQTFKEEKLEIKDEDLEKVTASDGTLPGGMDPNTFKKLIGNPEVMALLQSPKLQEAMELMMTCGKEELAKKMAEDAELQKVVQKLDSVLKTTQ